MATNTTINTQIVVQFDDQFSDAAKRANENYFKSFEDAQKKIESFKPIFETPFQGYFESLTKLFNELNTLEKTAWIGVLIAGTATVAKFSQELLRVGVTLGAFYLTWLAGTKLKEWLVGGQPVEEYVGGVKESLDQLGNIEPLALPPIPPDTVQSLETTKACLEQIQNMQDIFITVKLLDNASEQAKAVREEIEKIFSQDITQKIKIIEETTRTAFSSFPGGSSSSFSDSPDSFFDDGLPEFQTSSPDLTGFNDSVGNSFASGIDRVPRDMIAMIHKDEAVLPKNRAEDFRRRGSNGISIDNLNFSFNVPNGLKLDREEFRNLAFMMRDELKRLDRRVN